jgi:hypothetical protein
MGSVPLKLKDSADFQKFTSTEENYLAYQVGLDLSSIDSTGVSALAFDSNGTNYSIGQFTDTSYDSAVGTGGDGSFLTLTTTNTLLRQTAGTLSITDSDYRLPILQRDSDGQRIINEMNDSDIDSLTNRLSSRIFTSDYVGTYKLATSAPSGDYTIKLENVTTDTRADGTSLQYNIYQRTSQTPPTKVLPFSIKRSNGDSGDYQGLQLMTDRQIKYSLGLKVRNKIASSNESVGSYRIFSSAVGTPTDAGLSGTWSSKGTATDTRQQIVDVNYTRGRVSTYARLRQSNFSADYLRTRNSAYSENYTTTRTSTYSAAYTTTRVSNFSLGFVGNYIGNFTRTRQEDFTRTRSSVFDYVGNYVGDFTGNYSRLLSFTGNFTGNYSRTTTDTTLLHTLDNPNPIGTTTYDYFSGEVAIDGNYAIVGAYGELSAEDLNGYNSGKAYIFNTTTGALVHTLDNPNAYGTTSGDLFGSEVGISGNYAIVGAKYEDKADAGDGGGVGTQSGKAYIFNVTTGALLHTLDNPNAYAFSAGDNFGQSVEIDGNYAIVGASAEDDAGGTQSGKAYIFNVTTGALVHTLDNPNDYGTSAGDLFGYAVDVSGNYAIVSAKGEDDAGVNSAGRAYIFNVTTGALVHTLDNPNPIGTAAFDEFGRNVSISGNYAILGAYMEDETGIQSSGKAYIFNVTTGALVHTLDNPNVYGTSAGDNFGWSVSISGDYAIVGAKNEDEASGNNSGKLYIFNVTTGTLVKTLDNPNAYGTPAGDAFGQKVDISGNYIIAGVYVDPTYGTTGKAYIFNMVTPADSFTRDSTRTSTRVSTYTINSTQDFLGNYTRTIDYLGNYTGDFLGEYTTDSQRTTPDDFTRDFLGNYTAEFTRTRASTFTTTRNSTYIGNYTGDYTGDYLGNFVGNYIGNYVGAAAGALATYAVGYTTWRVFRNTSGIYTVIVFFNGATKFSYGYGYSSQAEAITQVTGNDGLRYFKGPTIVNTFGTPGGTGYDYEVAQESGTTDYTRNSQTGFVGNYLSYRTGTGSPPGGTYGNWTDYDTPASGPDWRIIVAWKGVYDNQAIKVFDQTYATQAERDAVTVVTGLDGLQYRKGGFQANPVAGVTTYQAQQESGDFTRATPSTRTSLRVSTTDFLGDYSRNFEGNYSSNFEGNYSRNFTRTRTSTYLGADAFSRDFLGNYTGNYTRNFTRSFEGNYSRNFAGNYQGDYSQDYIGNYARTFTGNYAGSTIGSGNTNIETYTLYVRIA